MIGVVSKRMSRKLSSTLFSDTTGIFDNATRSFGTTSVISNVALIAGSSQHGKHRLASVASLKITKNYPIYTGHSFFKKTLTIE